MRNLLVQLVANAAAIAVAAWVVAGITLTGDDTGQKVLTLILVTLLFGLVNFLVKPVVKLFSLPLFVLTLGLFALVVNGLMLWLTSWLSDQVDLAFRVDGFWAAFWGALIIGVVSWAAHLVLSRAVSDGDD